MERQKSISMKICVEIVFFSFKIVTAWEVICNSLVYDWYKLPGGMVILYIQTYCPKLVLLCEGKNKTMEKELKNNNLEETSHILIPVKYYMM